MGAVKLDILNKSFRLEKVGDNFLNISQKGCVSAYVFGFNGQEKDDEIAGVTGAHLNFKFRMYDSRIARFFAVDPLTKDYPYWTPYQFAGLMPIWARELEGLEPIITSQQYQNLPGEKSQVATMYGDLDDKYYNKEEGTQFFRVNAPNCEGKLYIWRSDNKPMLKIPNEDWVVTAIDEPIIKDIKFKANTADFSDNNSAYTDLIDIEDFYSKGNYDNLTITVNANYGTPYKDMNKETQESADKLLENRGKKLKQDLVNLGIDEDKITIQIGSVNSGSTKTEFKLETE